MDKDKITQALQAAQHLINQEYESLLDDDLIDEYQSTLTLLDEALHELTPH